MCRNVLVASFRRFLFLLILLGCVAALSAYGQEKPLPQSGQPAIAAGELVPLEVRDFDPWEHTEKSLYSADLLRAIPDALYLYFLGYPRVGVSRGPSIPRTTNALPQANQPTAQVPIRPSGSSYSLEGQVRLVSPGTAPAADTLTGRGSQLLIVRYQVWLNGAGPEAKLIMEKSFVTGSGELPDRLNEVARDVIDKIVPPDAPVNVFVSPVETNCFSSDREKRFYEETLSGLLRTTLVGSGFVKPAQDRAGVYVVTESATAAAGGCVLHATLTNARGETLIRIEKPGSRSDILETQAEVNQQIVDALHLESHSLGQKTGSSASLSPREYVRAADKYQQADPELAAALYRKALSVDPSNQEALNRLAQSLLDSGRPKEVVDLIPAPTNASQFALLAAAYLKLNNSKKAIAELQAGLRLGSSDPKFYLQAATILEQTGDYAAAANALELGQKYAKPNDQFAGMANETRRRGAAALLNANKNDQALALLRPSLAADPTSEWGQRLAGIAYHRLGDTQEAEQHLKEAMRIQPTAYSEAELGSMRLEQKRYAEARSFAQQAIDTDPKWIGGFSVLQDSVQNAEDARETVAWLKKYLTMEPPNRTAMQVWGLIQTKYLPDDAAAMHQLYEAYKSATKDVPYTEWLPGWTNLVELSMVDNHVEEAAALADALSHINLSPYYRMNMEFYSWLTRLLLGDCGRFGTSFDTFLGFVEKGDLPVRNNWDFTATHKFIEVQRSQRKLNQSGMSLVDGTLKLLENPITPNAVQQFSNDAAQLRKGACPAN